MWTYILSAATSGTVFLYVGPDDDAFSLNLLRPSETKVLLVEPLVAWRNRFRRGEQHIDNENFDRLHECEVRPTRLDPRFRVCVHPLTMKDVNEYVESFLTNLAGAATCNAPSMNGLTGLQILNLTKSIHRMDVTLMTSGIRRQLRILFRRVQEVNWTAYQAVGRISTLNFLGVGPSASAAAKLFCSSQNRAQRVRIVAGRHPWLQEHSVGARNPVCCVPNTTCDFHMGLSNPMLNSYSWTVDTAALCTKGLHYLRRHR